MAGVEVSGACDEKFSLPTLKAVSRDLRVVVDFWRIVAKAIH
jgi:hypothetical protein